MRYIKVQYVDPTASEVKAIRRYVNTILIRLKILFFLALTFALGYFVNNIF